MAWHDEVFDGKYDRFTFHLFTPRRNQLEAEFIRTALKLKPGEEVLDLACGYGRHAILLARRGIKVVGLDCTERYLEMARRRAERIPAEFVCGDMRTMDWEERFDAAYCFFTSFGFFDDDTNLDVLRRVACALRPGGRFLLDVQNREVYCSPEENVKEPLEFEQDGRDMVIISESTFDPLTSIVQVTLKLYGWPEGQEELAFAVRLYSYTEMRGLMKQVGLEVTEQFGDSDGSGYTLKSPRMIIVAHRV